MDVPSPGGVVRAKSWLRRVVELRWGEHLALALDHDAHGRPVMAGRHVSVSHAGPLTVLAIAARPVGVDVEARRPDVDVEDWVRREAVLKAMGVGLAVDPWSFDLGPSSVTAWRAHGRRPNLRLRSLDVIAGHAVAIALAGRRPFTVELQGRAAS